MAKEPGLIPGSLATCRTKGTFAKRKEGAASAKALLAYHPFCAAVKSFLYENLPPAKVPGNVPTFNPPPPSLDYFKSFQHFCLPSLPPPHETPVSPSPLPALLLLSTYHPAVSYIPITYPLPANHHPATTFPPVSHHTTTSQLSKNPQLASNPTLFPLLKTQSIKPLQTLTRKHSQWLSRTPTLTRK